MRSVSMPSLFTRYSPDIEYIKKVLPDVVVMELIFPAFSINSRFEPHLAKECNFTFENGQKLNIPGYMLWKFLDMIPEALGSEKSGYLDHNIFTSDYGESLMRRIRSAYQAAFIDTRPEAPLSAPPIKAKLNLSSGHADVAWMSKLSDESEKYLSAAFIDFIATQVPIDIQVAKYVKEETSVPIFELGFKNIGNGMMGREILRKPWPDLSKLTFDEFLLLLSGKQQDNCPAQKSQLDLFSDVILRASDALAALFLAGLRSAPGYGQIAKELGCKSNKPTAATLINFAVKLSRLGGGYKAQSVPSFNLADSVVQHIV